MALDRLLQLLHCFLQTLSGSSTSEFVKHLAGLIWTYPHFCNATATTSLKKSATIRSGLYDHSPVNILAAMHKALDRIKQVNYKNGTLLGSVNEATPPHATLNMLLASNLVSKDEQSNCVCMQSMLRLGGSTRTNLQWPTLS